MPLPCREGFLSKLVPDTFYTTHVDDTQFSFNKEFLWSSWLTAVEVPVTLWLDL